MKLRRSLFFLVKIFKLRKISYDLMAGPDFVQQHLYFRVADRSMTSRVRTVSGFLLKTHPVAFQKERATDKDRQDRPRLGGLQDLVLAHVWGPSNVGSMLPVW